MKTTTTNKTKQKLKKKKTTTTFQGSLIIWGGAGDRGREGVNFFQNSKRLSPHSENY